MMGKVPSWDDWFMTMVYLVASKSKDPRTKIGAVVVGPGREVRSMGYNGLPRGVDDCVEERYEKGEKNFWFEHAERNAIYNATLIGASLRDCVMYTQGIPCHDCSRGIIQSGLREIVLDKKWNGIDLDSERYRRSFEMFKERGVLVRFHDTEFVHLEGVNDGIRWPLV